MIPTSKVAELLDKNRQLMDTLKDKQLSGFALVIAPDGEAVELVMLGSHADPKSFYMTLVEKLKTASEPTQYGGVVMPRGVR